MFISIVLQIVVGTLISIVFVIWMEYIRQPRLKLTIPDPVELNFPATFPAQRMKSLRLVISNSNLPFFLRWLLRLPAQRCFGTISFHHLDGQNIFGRSMQIRWIRSPEPLPIQATLGNQLLLIHDPVRLTPELNRDVFPGTEDIFDVAVRFDADIDCYGWSNENYFSTPQWRNPNWKLLPGRYLVRVEIQTSGKKCTDTFRLINDTTINDFRLEQTLPEDPVL